ncbi:MAG TPA: hypothetical protein VMV46_19575 [Thermoanaerobaculia bacterium]|nr:hypothetical protein [Thermoanaerobaculia bacterium]
MVEGSVRSDRGALEVNLRLLDAVDQVQRLVRRYSFPFDIESDADSPTDTEIADTLAGDLIRAISGEAESPS